MPPLYQDPLAAVARAEWGWLDVARAALEVSCEPWAVALVALAVYSFLDRDVRGVVKAFLPLAAALAVASALVLVVRAVGGAPRPVDAAGHSVGPFLLRAFPSGQAAAVSAFVAYTLLAHGRRALPAVAVAAALGVARGLGGPHPIADLAGGGAAGAALAIAAYAAALRLLPGGHLARLRAARRRGRGAAAAAPSPGSP